jgi:t-SNARE complex subunit (syntaxin)
MKNKNINKIKSVQNNYFRYTISNIQCLILNDFFNSNKHSLLKKMDNYLGDIKSIDSSVKNTLVSLIKKYQNNQEKTYTKLFNYFLKIENGILYIRDTDWENSKHKK